MVDFSYTKTKIGVMGDLAYAIGEYVGGATGDQVIVTGLGKILIADVTNSEAVSEQAVVAKNTDASGAQNGSIKLTLADGTNNTGEWIAFGYR